MGLGSAPPPDEDECNLTALRFLVIQACKAAELDFEGVGSRALQALGTLYPNEFEFANGEPGDDSRVLTRSSEALRLLDSLKESNQPSQTGMAKEMLARARVCQLHSNAELTIKNACAVAIVLLFVRLDMFEITGDGVRMSAHPMTEEAATTIQGLLPDLTSIFGVIERGVAPDKL